MKPLDVRHFMVRYLPATNHPQNASVLGLQAGTLSIDLSPLNGVLAVARGEYPPFFALWFVAFPSYIHSLHQFSP